MLIIPTSLRTAIILELGPAADWMNSAVFIFLAACAYLCWEMLISLLTGEKPESSRWRWLASAGMSLLAAVVLTSLMFGPVTFNAGQANWVSTSWGGVFGQASLLAFAICTLVTLTLRAQDAVRVGRSGHLTYPAWWSLGLLFMMAYGLLLALNEVLSPGSVLQDAARAVGFGLAVCGVGSVVGVFVIRRMRSGRVSSDRH